MPVANNHVLRGILALIFRGNALESALRLQRRVVDSRHTWGIARGAECAVMCVRGLPPLTWGARYRDMALAGLGARRCCGAGVGASRRPGHTAPPLVCDALRLAANNRRARG